MNICVFGSSSEQIDKIYLESAEHLGKKIAEKGYNLVFGAGKYGVMGASARGAYSAGGYTIGVTPDFFIDVGVVFDKCSELIVTDTMRERKGIMEDKVQYENDRIDKIQKQIRIFEYKISELRRTIQDYI